MMMIEIARGTLSAGTKRKASAAIMAQKLPRAKPRIARAAKSIVMLGA